MTAANEEKALKERVAEINDLYIDQPSGYFKEEVSQASFDEITDRFQNKQRNNQKLQTQIKAGRENLKLQNEVNELFEEPVLSGMDLSAQPVLIKPAAEKIQQLTKKVAESSAKDTSWGKDLTMILSLAQMQSQDYTAAAEKVNGLVEDGQAKADITLSGYLVALQGIALLADGPYKKQLEERLTPAETYLTQTNQDFAQQVTASETEMEQVVATYHQEIQQKLQTKRDQLATLSDEIDERNKTYTALVRQKHSLEQAQEKSSESEESHSESSSNASSDSSSSSSSDSSKESSSESKEPEESSEPSSEAED